MDMWQINCDYKCVVILISGEQFIDKSNQEIKNI